jgi:hypothetical protein
MDAVEYLEGLNRFLEGLNRLCNLNLNKNMGCNGCELSEECKTGKSNKEKVRKVEEWVKKNPKITRSDVLNAIFPKNIVTMNCPCPKNFEGKSYRPIEGCSMSFCDECIERYWNSQAPSNIIKIYNSFIGVTKEVK